MQKLKEAKDVIVKALRVIRARQISLYSAQAAYFAIFSAIPIFILLLAVLNLFVPRLSINVADVLLKYYPDSKTFITSESVKRFLDAGIAAVPTSILAVFWSASRGIRAIGEGISGIYGSSFVKKNLAKRYLYSFLYTLIFIVTILGTLLFLVFGKYIGRFLSNVFPKIAGVLDAILDWRFLIILGVLIAFFFLFYKLLGFEGMNWRNHLPGAVFTGVGWLLYSYLFSLYLKYFSGWQSIYGSLSVLMVLMLWVYSCMYILMMGALLNTYFVKRPKILK